MHNHFKVHCGLPRGKYVISQKKDNHELFPNTKGKNSFSQVAIYLHPGHLSKKMTGSDYRFHLSLETNIFLFI